MSYLEEQSDSRVVEAIAKPSEDKTPKQVREQRRYEIARDCMAAHRNHDYNADANKLAEWSVVDADALLAELEKSK